MLCHVIFEFVERVVVAVILIEYAVSDAEGRGYVEDQRAIAEINLAVGTELGSRAEAADIGFRKNIPAVIDIVEDTCADERIGPFHLATLVERTDFKACLQLCPANAHGRLDGENALVAEKRGAFQRLFINAVISAAGDHCRLEVEGKFVVANIFVLAGFDVLAVNIEAHRTVGHFDIAHERHVQIIENVTERHVDVRAATKQTRLAVQRCAPDIGAENHMPALLVLNFRLRGRYDVGCGCNSRRRR